ncbi:MAG TPA: hypothetical protein VFL17_02770 [Anaerolineae bacterium]|nr:hypothetical protein [Anaerolineae bacterium]
MRLLWDILKGAASDIAAEPYLFIVYNLLWVVMSLLIIPLPFATGGLFFAAREVSARRAVGWRTFFVGGRQVARPMYLWGALNLAVALILITNISFYGRLGNVFSDVIQSVLISAALVWLLLQLFVVPLLIQLRQPRLRVAVQDGSFLMLRHPLTTLAMALVVTVLIVASTMIPVLLAGITPAAIAVLSTRVVGEELARHRDEESAGRSLESKPK